MFMFEKLCRLCITDKGVSSTLNNSDTDKIILLDKLNLLAPGLLKINSSLPIGICTTCIAQLNQACRFMKNCFRSQEILNKYLEQLQNGLHAEQSKNHEIVINAMKLERNNAINYMNVMNIEELDFIKQENIIGFNDDSESIQVNIEDDIKEEEPNVQMEISEEECNYSIDIQSNRNLKECLSEDIIDIKNEIIDYECTELKSEDEIKLEEIAIPTITEKSDLHGFNSTEYSLTNNTKIKYNFELDRLCNETNRFLIDFQNKINNTTHSENDANAQNNVENLKDVHTALKTSSTRKIRQNSSKDSSCTNMCKIGKSSYECTICGKGFNSLYELRRHIRIHTGEKPYQCETCTKAFNTKGQLTEHIRIHTGEKPYQCKMCTKAFARRGDLMKHIRTHTGEKPYQCETCTKAFNTSGQLTEHIRTHTGEKPYQCKMCKKAFVRRGDLMKHIRTHTGEKPYQCKMCKKAYKQSAHLKTHILSTHATFENIAS